MSDTNFPLAADGGPDDLPRTLRREKEAREREAREARERLAKERAAFDPRGDGHAPHMQSGPSFAGPGAATDPYPGEGAYAPVEGEPLPAVVRRLDIPFGHLVVFFLKAVLAMVPALIVLGALLWGLGHLLQTYFPQLVKMQILIWFPN